jgi:NAD dependent epimerase/dehydratase family enzyme
VLGELSGQLLGDMYVVPERLVAAGYRFYYADVHAVISAALHRNSAT